MKSKFMLVALALVVALLIGAALYYLYAPAPQWPSTGLQRHSLDVQARQRQYSVYTPPGLAPGARVLIALHPSMASGDMMRQQVGGSLERLARRDGAIVVYPDGYKNHFNDCRRTASYSARTLNIDDVTFIRQIVERLVKDQQIDPLRVDALGYSNGAHMAFRLAVEASDWLRGVVMIAGNVPAPDNMDCRMRPTPSRRVVLIEGTLDPVNPYAGGNVTLFGFGNRGQVLSAQASADWFSQRLGLTPGADRVIDDTGDIQVRQQDWQGPEGEMPKARVRLVSLMGGGHTIPQADYRFPRMVGRTYLKDDILDAAWRLLDERASDSRRSMATNAGS